MSDDVVTQVKQEERALKQYVDKKHPGMYNCNQENVCVDRHDPFICWYSHAQTANGLLVQISIYFKNKI